MSESYPQSDMEMTVSWGDCDAAGISYYAKTFDWFTNARFQLLALYELSYMETFHHSGISLVCLTADCQYRKMLRPEEKIRVRTFVTDLTRTRMAFTYEVLKKDGTLAAEGRTTHAYVGNDGQPFNLKKRVPGLWHKLTDKWSRFEDHEEPG